MGHFASEMEEAQGSKQKKDRVLSQSRLIEAVETIFAGNVRAMTFQNLGKEVAEAYQKDLNNAGYRVTLNGPSGENDVLGIGPAYAVTVRRKI